MTQAMPANLTHSARMEMRLPPDLLNAVAQTARRRMMTNAEFVRAALREAVTTEAV